MFLLSPFCVLALQTQDDHDGGDVVMSYDDNEHHNNDGVCFLYVTLIFPAICIIQQNPMQRVPVPVRGSFNENNIQVETDFARQN